MWKFVLDRVSAIRGIIAVGLALALAPSASAQSTIIDTLINPSLDSNTSLSPRFLLGQRFINGNQDFDLFSFTARLSSTNQGTALFFLFDDVVQSSTGLPIPGFPLTILTQVTVPNATPTTFSRFTNPFRIRSNTAYWIVGLAEFGTVDFHFSSHTSSTFVVGAGSIPENFSTAFTLDSLDWINLQFGTPIVYNLRLTGTPVPANPSVAAPEPTSFTLLAMVVGGTVVPFLRRRRNSMVCL